MKIGIVLVSYDEVILQHFRGRRGAVVAPEIRKGHELNVYTVSGTVMEGHTASVLEKAYAQNDCVGLLAEDSAIRPEYSSDASVFLKVFSAGSANENPQNYFSRHLARWVKNLIFLSSTFSDGKQKKCLMLPLENFAAEEILALRRHISSQNDAGTFSENLEKILAKIRDRSAPKRKKSGSQHFLKDDRNYFSELGKERHGQSEISEPHSIRCNFNAIARFGYSLDRDIHYNVSAENEKIGGAFIGCHGDTNQIKPTTHLNMFPNGFIR